jgi:hypothetical protein
VGETQCDKHGEGDSVNSERRGEGDTVGETQCDKHGEGDSVNSERRGEGDTVGGMVGGGCVT